MKRFLLVLILLLAFCIPAHGADVLLGWEAPTTNVDGTPLTDLAGFTVYGATISDGYQNPLFNLDVGDVITTTVDVGDQEGVTLYFVVTAYDTSDNESDYSNEVSIPFPANPPAAPTNLTGTIQP